MAAEGLPVPSHRRRALERVRAALEQAGRIVLTTHVNADGDGAGSQAALAGWLLRRGREPSIVNPTPFPEVYEFLVEDLPVHRAAEAAGRRALEEAELFLVVDTSEASRLGQLAEWLPGRRVAVMDHHPPNPEPLGDPAVRDPDACATGELAYDLLLLAGEGLTRREAEGLYVAIATDTGSFRFSNTSPRAHRIAALLLEAGVKPEEMYRRLHAQFTPARLGLLQRALASLRVDEELPISWITLTHRDVRESGAEQEELEGIVEYARRLRGIEVALLLRELPGGRTKASLRSNGETDVAAVARSLGGGGHEKAAGVLLESPLQEATPRLLAAVREALRSASTG